MTDYDYLERSMIYGVVAVLVTMAFIFIIICMVVFCLSRSKTKKFLKESTQENYRKANSLYTAAILFTVFMTLFTLGGIAGFFNCVIEVWREQDTSRVVWDIVEIVEFLSAVTAFALGISALTAFGKARSLHSQLYPPAVRYYGNTPQYPRPTNTQQGYPQPYDPQRQYSQPTNKQQGYPQPYDPQWQYPQPVNTQQNTYSPPAEKMCPSCGVVNEGKNKFCIFCGKPL